MPVISNLTAQNASFVVQYGNYTDWNIFIALCAAAILLGVVSRFLPTKDESGKFIISVLSVLLAIAAVWASLSIAHLDYTNGASSVVNETTTQYIYPVQQVVASPAITIVCIIMTIFLSLSSLDIFLSILQATPTPPRKSGPGYNIDGKRVSFKKEEFR